MLTTQRNDPGSEMVRLLHDHHIAVGQRFSWLQTKFHHRTSTLIDLDQASSAGDTIDPIIYRWASNFEIAKFEQLLILAIGQHLPQQCLRSSLGRQLLIPRLACATNTSVRRL